MAIISNMHSIHGYLITNTQNLHPTGKNFEENLGYKIMLAGESQLTFWRSILPPSSGFNRKLCKKTAQGR
jgi:hypothetical protein